MIDHVKEAEKRGFHRGFDSGADAALSKRPTVERVAFPYPRCACPVADPETRRYREKNCEDFSCPAFARYRIDGVPMCRRHAGGTLITRLLGEAS